MTWIKRNSIILLIVAIAAVLRLWQLGVVPVSPDWDEAALGYNAYSILKTGKDEYGIWLPRALRSFDDYKPPLYTYLAIPSVAAFGLSVQAVRLPSALAGILAVLGTFLLVRELFQKDKYARTYASLVSFLLAISPWHLQFSRIAFEANIGITLNIWGAYALLRGLSSQVWLTVSAFLFGLSLYAYHSERIFAPLLVGAIVFLWRKELFRNKQKIILPIIVGLITVLPLVPVVFDKTSLIRLQGTSALADKTGLLARSVGKLQDDAVSHNALGTIFDNRRIVYAQKIVEGYVSHFSLRWLFLLGDNDRHHAPDNGLLYVWELPFLFWGLFALWKKGGRAATLIFTWFFLAPLAASPTSETPHAIRTLVFLPTFQVFTAMGLMKAYSYIRRNTYLLAILVCVLIIGNIFYYFHMYYGHMNQEYSQFWQFGYAQAVDYAQAHKNKYKKIVVSTKLEQPHMFFLFYTTYDPVKYLAGGGTATGGFAEIRNKFDIYEFRPIHWGKEIHDGSILYIGTPKEISSGSTNSIFYLNGQEAMRIAE